MSALQNNQPQLDAEPDPLGKQAAMLGLISRLLDYPDESLFEHETEISRLISNSDMAPDLRDQLLKFFWQQLDKDLLDWQSEYDALFERGRSLGLWLFEHVHGESRDRGQAMVDLTAKYKEAGLMISEHQLPDYIPMFLEFLATQDDENSREWLLDVEHILALLQCRLERRESGYALLFESLLQLAGSELKLDDMRDQVAGEKRDDSKKAIDKEWEDEEVTFGADSLDKSCDQAKRRPSQSQRKDLDVPLTWMGFNESSSTSEGVAK